jgi:hypothetical protein
MLSLIPGTSAKCKFIFGSRSLKFLIIYVVEYPDPSPTSANFSLAMVLIEELFPDPDGPNAITCIV